EQCEVDVSTERVVERVDEHGNSEGQQRNRRQGVCEGVEGRRRPNGGLRERLAQWCVDGSVPVVWPGRFFVPFYGVVIECTRLVRSEEHTSELQSRFDLVCR